MKFSPVRNPDSGAIRAIIEGSRAKAARRIVDPRNGDAWYWPAEAGTHREDADSLGVPYDRPPAAGDIATLD